MANQVHYLLTAFIAVLTIVAMVAPLEQSIHGVMAVLSLGVLQYLLQYEVRLN